MSSSAASAAPAWRSRITRSGEAAPAELKANAKNWRTHPKAQQQAMASVLTEVGWVQRLVVNRTTGNLIDGHLRLELALSRGEPSIPVIYVELSEAEEALILATLDPLAAMAETDQAKLLELLAGVTISQADLAAMVGNLAGMRKAGRTDPDDVPEVPDEPFVQPGDLWLLGEHRLLCGDATSPDDMARLMTDGPATVLFTDPPWNVAIGQDSNPRHRQRAGLQNDALSDVDFRAFLAGFAEVAKPHVAGDLYVILGASE